MVEQTSGHLITPTFLQYLKAVTHMIKKYREKIVDRQVGRNAQLFAQAIAELPSRGANREGDPDSLE